MRKENQEKLSSSLAVREYDLEFKAILTLVVSLSKPNRSFSFGFDNFFLPLNPDYSM